MNRKINRNEKYKYSNEKKLALGEDKNTSTPITIAQEDDSNIWGHSKSTFVEEGRGSLNREQKRNGEGVLACAYVRFF